MNQGIERFDAVVVGSGFGGSISALRLAEAGKSVAVLERGRRYLPGEFPRDVTQVDELFWRYPDAPRARGLYDLRLLSGIAIVAASAVGGGSLIYANIHIRPDAKVFDDPRWPSSINRQMLDPYYDKVAAALQVAPVPEETRLAKRDVFHDAAGRLGREVFDPDQAVTWNSTTSEGAPPSAGCRLVAECEFGCQYGAKNSMDRTYLARAEALGAEVRAGVLVSHLSPVDGGYAVHCRDVASGRPLALMGTRVVICAGTLGSNEILLRSRDQFATLPSLSRMLGVGFSGNGDFLGSIQNSTLSLEPWIGPDVTSVMPFFDEPPEFTLAAPTFSRPVMEVLASFGQPNLGWLGFLSPILWPLFGPGVRFAFRRGLLSKPTRFRGRGSGDAAHMTNLFAIGRDNAGGVISLKRGRLDVRWAYERENTDLIARMERAMREVAQAYGGTYGTLPTWQVFRRIISVHPLGGCRMSDSVANGVVSTHGEVHGYPGLFVSDGSVIPTAIGFHPVMTIAAVAEHSAQSIVASYPS